MPLLFCDSFDHYTVNSQAARKGWSGNFGAGIGGRNGTTGVELAGGVSNTVNITAGVSFVMGIAIYPGGIGDGIVFAFLDSGSLQCEMRFNQTPKSIDITRNGSVLGSSAINAWNGVGYQYVEFKVTIDNTAGSAEVRVNGVVKVTVSGVDTQATANAFANQARIQGISGSSWFDDFYVASGTTYFGDVRVKTIFPDGAGNYSQFTPSAGSNYQCVDESPGNDDTDYVASSTAGHKDSYNFGAVGIVGGVKGVQVLNLVRKDDAAARSVRRLIRIGGTNYTGSDVSLGTSYAYAREVLATSPASSANWTVSEIDGAEFGIEVVT